MRTKNVNLFGITVWGRFSTILCKFVQKFICDGRRFGTILCKLGTFCGGGRFATIYVILGGDVLKWRGGGTFYRNLVDVLCGGI